MPPRTKSCAICRKKRIRCDATLPQCLMCIRTGRQCPGIPDGPLIVDMTKTAKHGMQKRKTKAPSKSNDPVWVWSDPDNATVHRISQKAMMTEAFYARFLSYFTSEGEGTDIRNKWTWLHRLPLLSTDGSNDALVLAVQATASAYCAADSTNPALTRHAWDLYGEALRTHSRFLARSKSKCEVTIHMVSTSVLFSFFEAMQASSANAYRSHIHGVAKMLEVTGSGQCQQGILCQIFYHLRTQMAFVHLTGHGNETPVQVKKILHDTLEYTRLPMFQRLMCHIATLSEMYLVLHDDAERGRRQQPLDLTTYIVVKMEVGTLWLEYTEAAAQKNEQVLWQDLSTGITHYRNAYTALMVAYFSAARVLLKIVSPRLAASFPDLADHYAIILDASQHLQTREIGCAYMRMATPLLLVAMHSPRREQRREAIGCFESWIGGSMRGISALALEAIYRRRALSTRPWLQSSIEDTASSSDVDETSPFPETSSSEAATD